MYYIQLSVLKIRSQQRVDPSQSKRIVLHFRGVASTIQILKRSQRSAIFVTARQTTELISLNPHFRAQAACFKALVLQQSSSGFGVYFSLYSLWRGIFQVFNRKNVRKSSQNIKQTWASDCHSAVSPAVRGYLQTPLAGDTAGSSSYSLTGTWQHCWSQGINQDEVYFHPQPSTPHSDFCLPRKQGAQCSWHVRRSVPAGTLPMSQKPLLRLSRPG